MLSTEPIKNVGQAAHYFLGQDNYYLEDAEGKERSEWWGQGAKELGLIGKVDERRFTELLRGQLPDGQQLGSREGGEIKHRPGVDLTFSVPKSVSLVALLGEDKRVFDAISRATDKVLQQIEQDCAQARITQEGVTSYQNTKSLVIAKFLHDVSREGDPQAHVHCVVLNMTKRPDGQWRSLASKSGDYSANAKQAINGFLELVRHNKHHYGMLFDAELAYELTKLSYSIRKAGEHGSFEIDGISPQSIDAYSTRRRQINSYMESYGYSGAKAAAVATLKTRKAKNINRETLQELWQARSQAHQIDGIGEAKRVVEAALRPDLHKTVKELPDADMVVAREAIHVAMAYLSETHVTIQHIQLINVALQYALGERVNVDAILQAIDEQQAKGELIPLNKSDQINFTTKRLIEYEQAIIQSLKQKSLNGQPLLAQDKIEGFLSEQSQLTAEQCQAIKTLFSSQDKVMALEGPTGSGKTTLIKPMMELARLSGYQPILLTPSKANSIHLEREFRSTPKSLREWIRQLFNNSQYDTVSGFLKKQESKNQLLAKQVIFVDKATLLASKQMHDFVKLVQQSDDARLIVIGDSKSLLSWQTGAPFLQMIQHGITKATLTQNLKPQHGSIKMAIADTLQNNIVAAFEKIGHRIIAIEGKGKCLEAMAVHFAALTPMEQKNTLILMPTKQKCCEINFAIREALKQQHIIQQEGLTVDVLLPKNLKEIEYGYAKSYQSGQQVRFNETYPSLQILKGEYFQIKTIQRERNLVILENAKGKTINWNPAKVGGKAGKVEVFEVQTREVVIGETLTWQRNDYQRKLHKGERLQVTQIDGQWLQLARLDNKTVWVNAKDAQTRHFDYGYASTSYQKSDVTAPIVIAYQNSSSRQSHQRLFYQILAQATQQVWLYTENSKQLRNQIQQHTGDKITALDMLLDGHASSESWGNHYALLEKAVSNAINSLQQTPLNEKTPEQLAHESVQYALAHLAEREAAFEHKEVMQVALKHILGDVAPQHVQAAILDAEAKGDLIRGLCSTNGIHWTTREALVMEREIVQLAREHQGELTPFAPLEIVENHLQKTNPKPDHQQAIRTIAGCQDRIVLIQGHAGTGKTTMLKNVEYLLQDVQSLLNQQGHQLLCLAPTNSAVKELKERRLKAQTVDSFIAEFKLLQSRQESLPQYQYQRVIAVDESSMLSNRRLHELLKITQLTQTRLLIVGDAKQYQAIESGKPFIILLYSGLIVAYLTHIERQKNLVVQKAVEQVYNHEFAAAFKTLAKHIIEIGQEKVDGKIFDNQNKRLEAISEDYLSRSLITRAQTMIITLGNDDREIVNELIREGLKNKGELYGESLVTQILVPRDMTKVELTRSANYKINNIVRFNYFGQTGNIGKHEYLTVIAINSKENLLTLEKENGEKIVWRPPLNKEWVSVEVYDKREREIQAGDLIRWTRTDKQRGFLSPDLVRVELVSQDKCLFREINITKDGIVPSDKVFEVYPNKQTYQHWDHAYAMTGYSAQGKSIPFVILHLESFRKYLASQPSVLVMLTRAIQDLVIYTDNQETLLRVILGNTGEKSSALETVGEWKQVIKEMPHTNSTTTHISTQKVTPANDLKKPLFDVKRISQLLNENAELVLERLLGEPKERKGSQYRYGNNKGSLVVTLAGDKRGLWHDFQTGDGGDLLRLIARQAGLDVKVKSDFKKILNQALGILGVSEEIVRTESGVNLNKFSTTLPRPKELSKEQKRSLNKARHLATESQPIENTLAERYLREHRGITLKKIPDNFRFHPRIYSATNVAFKPALLVIAKNNENKVQAVQAIFLDEITANKADVKLKKQTWGVLASSGASVDLKQRQETPKIIYLAEGPETALSIYEAMPNAHVKAVLSKSNFKNVEIKGLKQSIVLCLDNDGDNPSSDKLVNFAAERLLSDGKQVWIAKPELTGKDYNDLLKEQGIHAVKNNIENAIPYEDYRDQKITGLTLKIAMIASESMKYPAALRNAEVIERFIDTKSHNTLPTNLHTEKLQVFTDRLLTNENDKFKTFFESIPQKTNNQSTHKNVESIDKQLFNDGELDR